MENHAPRLCTWFLYDGSKAWIIPDKINVWLQSQNVKISGTRRRKLL